MSKSRFPGATYLPLPEHDEQGSYTKTQLIFHSTGTKASAEANKRYFSRRDITVESTFIVNYDGSCLQVMPASARADANGSANRRAMSVEVVGTADEPFTPDQLKTCIAIAQWACQEHPIERRKIPSESESGIGWHVMFGAPGPWTSVRGKQCPGGRRIVQVVHQIIPAVRPGVQPTKPAGPEQEDEMTPQDWDKLNRMLDDKFRLVLRGESSEGKPTGHPNLANLTERLTAIESALGSGQDVES